MKIRSLTFFIDPAHLPTANDLQPMESAAAAAKRAYQKAGIEVQTLRLATSPFPRWVQPLTQSRVVEVAATLETLAREHGFEYVSMGPALPDLPESYRFIPDMLAATQGVFFSGIIASQPSGIHMSAVRACADIIQKASTLEGTGFGNLRFAALANVPAGSPFFPAAYSPGGPPAFAIATQAADLAVVAFENVADAQEGSQALTAQIEQQARRMTEIGQKIASSSRVLFAGIDFSLAPFPAERKSLGTAFERLGIPAVGLQGSLTAAAILTNAIDAAQFARTGFNGLLLPILEDATLAKRAAEGTLPRK